MDIFVTNTPLTIAVHLSDGAVVDFVKKNLSKTHHQITYLNHDKDVAKSLNHADILLTDHYFFDKKSQTKSLEKLKLATLTSIIVFGDQLPSIPASFMVDLLHWPIKDEVFMTRINIACNIVAREKLLNIKESELSDYHKLMIAEQAIAKNIFEEFVQKDGIEYHELSYLLSPLSTYNGDILLAHKTPSGVLNAMLGDFTGHGLPAAIGSIPTAQMFYTMSEKGFSIVDIATEINRKLKQLLPTHLFCAACLFSYDAKEGKLLIWQGGLPVGFLISEDGNRIFEINSNHLPLGVLSENEFDSEVEVFDINEPMKLTFFTDGFIEVKNSTGDVLPQEKIIDCLVNNQSSEQLAALKALIRSHTSNESIVDDIAIVCVGLSV